MESGAIIKPLDAVEDRRARISAGDEAAVIHRLVFQTAPERLDERVVVAVALPAHRGDESLGGDGLLKLGAGELTAAVGVLDERGLRPALRDGPCAGRCGILLSAAKLALPTAGATDGTLKAEPVCVVLALRWVVGIVAK